MYGPSKGDMQFILTLAAIGAVATIVGVIGGAVWLISHIHFS